MADKKIVASPHRSLNTSKGVIRCRDLAGVSAMEITDELKPQGITDVYRVVITKEGRKIDTNIIILTFDQPNPPNSIKVGYLNVVVEEYITNPLRCFRCLKFGHSETKCRSNVVCHRCAGADHEGDSCSGQLKCANCGEPHMAFSRNCPTWQKEKQVRTIKAQKNITYPEARKLVENAQKTSFTNSYANTVKPKTKMVDMGTQTSNMSTQTETSVIPTKIVTTTKPSLSTKESTKPIPNKGKPSAPKNTGGHSTAKERTPAKKPAAEPEFQEQRKKLNRAGNKQMGDRISKSEDTPIKCYNKFEVLPMEEGLNSEDTTPIVCRISEPHMHLSSDGAIGLGSGVTAPPISEVNDAPIVEADMPPQESQPMEVPEELRPPNPEKYRTGRQKPP